MKRLLIVLLLVALVFSVVYAQGGKEPAAKKGGWRIAMSNDYAGNSWRQTMIKDFETVAKIALDKGLVAEAKIFTTNRAPQPSRPRRSRTSSLKATMRSC